MAGSVIENTATKIEASELVESEQTEPGFKQYVRDGFQNHVTSSYLREFGFGFGYRYTQNGNAVTQTHEFVKIIEDISKAQKRLGSSEAWEPEEQ